MLSKLLVNSGKMNKYFILKKILNSSIHKININNNILERRALSVMVRQQKITKKLIMKYELQANFISNWRRQMEYNDKRRKVIPKLIYLHNPWKYLMTKLNIWQLMLFWDYHFDESEFIRGSTQAAILLTDIIRSQDATNISRYTTPIGFQQITRDMLLSRNDARLKLVKFDPEHIRRAIPMKVSRRSNFGRRYCFIDMLFVGLRNTKDFDSAEEAVEINETLRKLDADLKTPVEVLAVPHRIVFAEIFMRFRRDYSEQNLLGKENNKDTNWSVSFYKILTFDVLNYDPRA